MRLSREGKCVCTKYLRTCVCVCIIGLEERNSALRGTSTNELFIGEFYNITKKAQEVEVIAKFVV